MMALRKVEALQVFAIPLEIEKRKRGVSDDGRDGSSVSRWRCGQGSRLELNIVTFRSECRRCHRETDRDSNRFDCPQPLLAGDTAAPEARTEGEPFAFSGRAVPLGSLLPLFLCSLPLANLGISERIQVQRRHYPHASF
jgi:hypothetical protein